MKKVGIIACSNGQSREFENQNNELIEWLKSKEMTVICSDCIYEKDSIYPGSLDDRAEQLMQLYIDAEIQEIYDISGGDIANQILDYLDYEKILRSRAVFWGYSDLTTIINAIYTQTGKASVLYQVKNMVWGDFQEVQRNRFINREELFNPSFEFLNGDKIEGVVVGGNIRCFLKLAGTKYFPNLKDKVLLLEALGGEQPQLATYLAQLKQLGAFEKISGILLGTFTMLEKDGSNAYNFLKEYAGDLPVAKTNEIGHGNDSKAIWIGKNISLCK